MKTQACFRRTMASRLCWTNLAYHNCRHTFIVSKPKNIFWSKHLDWIMASVSHFFSLLSLWILSLTVFCSFSLEVFCFQFFSFIISVFKLDARGAMTIYFNGVDSFRVWTTENVKQKTVLWSLYFSRCRTALTWQSHVQALMKGGVYSRGMFR